MNKTELDLDPFLHDPARWGASMAHHTELLTRCLDAVSADGVAEVGAYAGDLTRILIAWARGTGAKIQAIDPSPQPALVALAEENETLALIHETSLSALTQIELPAVIILDGDHNYYTVSEELRLIGERAEGAQLPLLLFHDVAWPHARRDDYFDREQIPEDFRHPIVGEGAGIFPGDPGTRRDGLPYPRSAAHEGGLRNGVLTAVEDFVSAREGLRLVVVPAFFGFGAVWSTAAPWAQEIEAILGPWDRNPLLERLEANRVLHIAQEHALRIEVWALQERMREQEAVLQRLVDSSAFGVAERLSKLRVRAGIATGAAAVSKQDLQRALAR